MKPSDNNGALRDRIAQQLAQHDQHWREYVFDVVLARFPDIEIYQHLARIEKDKGWEVLEQKLLPETVWRLIHNSQPNALRADIADLRAQEHLPQISSQLASEFMEKTLLLHETAQHQKKAGQAQPGYDLDPAYYCPFDGRLYILRGFEVGYLAAVVGRWDEGIPIWGLTASAERVELLNEAHPNLDSGLIYGRHREFLKWLAHLPDANRTAFRRAEHGDRWITLRKQARKAHPIWPTQETISIATATAQ